ncbi:MAG: hypothetical protein NC184_00495 [Roseburia sp.]|nr:hypothetical protein [Roseburia sp.]
MSKDLSISRLCDAYGALLTDHRLELVRAYYDDDLSLAEIAENFGITRQAALCSIKQAEKQLRRYESKIGYVELSDRLIGELDLLSEQIASDISAARSTVDRIAAELRQ